MKNQNKSKTGWVIPIFLAGIIWIALSILLDASPNANDSSSDYFQFKGIRWKNVSYLGVCRLSATYDLEPGIIQDTDFMIQSMKAKIKDQRSCNAYSLVVRESLFDRIIVEYAPNGDWGKANQNLPMQFTVSKVGRFKDEQ